MVVLNKIAQSFASQSAASIVVGAITFILQITLARQLGPDSFGTYGIAASIAGIGFIFQDGGFRSLLYREATHPTQGLPDYLTLFSRALGWNILASGFLLVLAIGGTLYSAIIGIAVAIMVVTNMGRIVSLDISSLMRANDQFTAEAKWQVKNRLSVNLLMIVAAFLSNNLIVILACGAVAQLGNLLLSTVRAVLRVPKFAWNTDIFRICATLVAIDLVTALYFRSDVLIMAALGRTREEIGIYAALSRIIEAYIFIVAPMATIFFRSARLKIANRQATGRILWLLSTITAVPTLIVLVLSMHYEEWMIRLIFGTSYQSGAAYLPWVIAACCAAAPNALLGQVLLANNRERYFLLAVIGALIVNLTLNTILIATRGAAGAAMATFATEASLLLFLAAAFYAPMKNPAIGKDER